MVSAWGAAMGGLLAPGAIPTAAGPGRSWPTPVRVDASPRRGQMDGGEPRPSARGSRRSAWHRARVAEWCPGRSSGRLGLSAMVRPSSTVPGWERCRPTPGMAAVGSPRRPSPTLGASLRSPMPDSNRRRPAPPPGGGRRRSGGPPRTAGAGRSPRAWSQSRRRVEVATDQRGSGPLSSPCAPRGMSVTCTGGRTGVWSTTVGGLRPAGPAELESRQDEWERGECR